MSGINIDDDILGIAEIKTQNAIYTYNDKYTKGIAERLIPAPLTPHEVETLSQIAKKAHQVLGCQGLARSDYMYDGKDFYILEINTQPGFTQTSFATLKAKQRGWTIEELVAKIIDSALSHHQGHAQEPLAPSPK